MKYKTKIISTNKLNDFLSKNESVQIVDAFEHQLKELYLLDNVDKIGLDKDKLYRSIHFKKYIKAMYSTHNYIFFPWLNAIVKCVTKRDYLRLKTNRNRDLITEEEQNKLLTYKIGVFGMSVGSNIAIILAQAGISSKMILADFDKIDTSNLNRILAGVHEVGLNKAIVAARKIYEGNPYSDIKIFKNGINKAKVDELLRNKKIDCIVEEIDDMKTKIDIRKCAIKYKVPVFMVTDNGDRAVLSIERYELGYQKIFGKDISYWNDRMKNYNSKKDFADIVINNIVGGEKHIDPRMLKSAHRVISKELVSWPQLGSSAILGGVAVTVAIKKLLRNELTKKFYREYINILE